jgi:acetyl esterase/lipase
MLMQLGTRELQFDDMMAFAEKARKAGVAIEVEPWDDMVHVFQLFPVLAEAGRAIARVGAYLRAAV